MGELGPYALAQGGDAVALIVSRLVAHLRPGGAREGELNSLAPLLSSGQDELARAGAKGAT